MRRFWLTMGLLTCLLPARGSVPPDVRQAVVAVRERHGLPALAAGIVTREGLVWATVTGVRRVGSEVAASLEDHWHLGSNTKAMTATLAGRLVDRGMLEWETSLEGVFPELAAAMDPAFRPVTLRQLLSHRAGLPANLVWRTFDRQVSVREARVEVVRQATAKPPEHPPGTQTLYSNLGYVVAGAMIERILDRSWEEALIEEVFEPLGMTAGFGGTGTPGQLDQPWGHDDRGRPVRSNGPGTDNPPVLGPAGRVHGSLADWARFVRDQLEGARGRGKLLETATYHTLHTAVDGGDQGLGWLVTERSWAGGKALHHTGSNTMNYANVWIAPEKGFAILVVCNQGGETAFRATDETVAALIPQASVLAGTDPARDTR